MIVCRKCGQDLGAWLINGKMMTGLLHINTDGKGLHEAIPLEDWVLVITDEKRL